MATDHSNVQWHLNSIGRHVLLTPAEEITLGNRVQAWIALRDQNIPEEELTLQQRRTIRRGQNALAGCTRPTCVCGFRLRKYLHAATHMEMSDLIQCGNQGMARAIELFKPNSAISSPLTPIGGFVRLSVAAYLLKKRQSEFHNRLCWRLSESGRKPLLSNTVALLLLKWLSGRDQLNSP